MVEVPSEERIFEEIKELAIQRINEEVNDYNSLRNKIEISLKDYDSVKLENEKHKVETNIEIYEKSNEENRLITGIAIFGSIAALIISIAQNATGYIEILQLVLIIFILLSTCASYINIKKINIQKIANLRYYKITLDVIKCKINKM